MCDLCTQVIYIQAAYDVRLLHDAVHGVSRGSSLKYGIIRWYLWSLEDPDLNIAKMYSNLFPFHGMKNIESMGTYNVMKLNISHV